MKRLIVVILVGLIAWQAFGSYKKHQAQASTPQAIVDTTPRSSPRTAERAPPNYKCDGRTHCSQMSSCEEATWFLRNCPGTKMDGNNDGIPCEKQWCR